MSLLHRRLMANIKIIMGFESTQWIFVEIKFLNVADDAPKHLKYQWMMMSKTDQKITKLIFDRIDNSKRLFVGGICIDAIKLIVEIGSQTIPLTNITSESIAIAMENIHI